MFMIFTDTSHLIFFFLFFFFPGLSLEVTEAAKLYMNRQVADGRHKWQFGFHSDMKNGKSSTVTAAWHKGTPYNCFIDRRYTSTYGLEHKKEILHFNEKKKKEQNLKLIKKNKGTIIRSIRAGKQLIGTRLVILWNSTMTWFNGTCMAYNATTHLYYIKYDSAADATNEETEWLDLDHVNKKDNSITWHIASTPKTKIQKATKKSKRQTSSTSSSKVSSTSSSSTSSTLSSSSFGDGEGFCVGSQVKLCNTNYCGIIKDMLQKDEMHVHVEWSDSKNTKVLTTNIEFNHTSTSSSSNTVRTFDLTRNGLTGQGMIRYLHPIEVERLQTFPDNWTKDLPKTHRFKMLGNAVTVSVVEYICTNLDFSGNGDGGVGGSSSGSGSGGGKNDVKVEISNKQNIVNDKSSGNNSSSSSSNKMEVRKVPLYMNEDDVKGIKSNRWGTGGTHISKKRKVVESDVVTDSKKKKKK
jgi:site-specific DNA-cytosine methylase